MAVNVLRMKHVDKSGCDITHCSGNMPGRRDMFIMQVNFKHFLLRFLIISQVVEQQRRRLESDTKF